MCCYLFVVYNQMHFSFLWLSLIVWILKGSYGCESYWVNLSMFSHISSLYFCSMVSHAVYVFKEVLIFWWLWLSLPMGLSTKQPPIDNIWAMTTVWRKITSIVLCCAHTRAWLLYVTVGSDFASVSFCVLVEFCCKHPCSQFSGKIVSEMMK